eukprot:3943432-Pleurochrysis_carterae.AAC.3
MAACCNYPRTAPCFRKPSAFHWARMSWLVSVCGSSKQDLNESRPSTARAITTSGQRDYSTRRERRDYPSVRR